MTKRSQLEEFDADVHGIMGNQPQRAEHALVAELYIWLFGDADKGISAGPIDGTLKGRYASDGEFSCDLRFATWGGQFLRMLPPTYTPVCRVWYMEFEDEEIILGLIDVSSIPQDKYPDLTTIIMKRLIDSFGNGVVTQI